MKSLRAIEPAYAKYDQALAAARKKDFSSARSLAEGGDAFAAEGRTLPGAARRDLACAEAPQEALPYYQKAIDLNSDYFGSYLGAGVAQFQAGNHAKARSG
jgi:tetratricopeptide (TPR) repeat protein